jgi:hypothetical protein
VQEWRSIATGDEFRLRVLAIAVNTDQLLRFWHSPECVRSAPKIIHAEGEVIASDKLAQAAAIIDREPAAITLRCLRTLTQIGAENNSRIIFRLPREMMRIMKMASEKV